METLTLLRMSTTFSRSRLLRAFDQASRPRRPSILQSGCRSRDTLGLEVVTRHYGPSWDLQFDGIVSSVHDKNPIEPAAEVTSRSTAKKSEHQEELTLHKPPQHATPRLQQRMSHDNLQKPLQPPPPLLNHTVIEPVQVHFSGQGWD
jgi:hypothetical protein